MSEEELQLEVERDVEESEEDLDQYPSDDPVGFWEKKQRDLLTSAVDYNLSTLSQLIRSKQIDLSPKYQRRNRWTTQRKSKLVESFLMNVPIPPIFLNEDEYGHYSVIDGKQRLTAVNEFLLGRFSLSGLEVFSEFNGLPFEGLPSTLQTVLETRANLRAIIILRQSDADIKYQVFQRLNTGGIKLNPQEIRNSAWPGLLNSMILEESESREFHSALGIRDKSKSSLYREMRDAEFVLRFLTFHKDWATFSGGMGRRLDEYMALNHGMLKAEVEEHREAFRLAVKKAVAAFGEHAFRRWVPGEGKNFWRRQVLAAAFDAEIFAVMDFDERQLADNQAALISGLQELFTDSDFRKSVDSATNTPTYFRDRIKAVKNMIAGVLGK
ncbi:DUF262 domain-containing protein [Saccharothrix hoggarensis]|uniref:DUF262 domain-containing protein n=1 Tax=Saccharothrix hoggarensis TaxID=913853 RepID=A0ABW3QTX9_9PSEU